VAGIIGSAPTFYAIIRKKQRLAAFEAQLADAIDLLARALRAGHPLSAGFKLVADESPDPIGTEFRRVFEEQRFGMTVDESLHSLITRVDLLDVRMFVTSMLIQRDVGGNLAEILDSLAGTVRTRFTILAKVRAFTAQARLSGYVLAMLPVALGILLFMVNPPYILALFQEPLGRVMLAVCLVLQGIGYFWIKSIVDIRY
jgi:tight adherence protein B